MALVTDHEGGQRPSVPASPGHKQERAARPSQRTPHAPPQPSIKGEFRMATVPQTVPSRMTHNVAALFGHADDTLVAWQQVCTQAAEALRPQSDPERLAKALALAQEGAVTLAKDGAAQVTSGGTLYHLDADGACHCPDAQHRGAPCKHRLAVHIHQQATAQLAPSTSAAAPRAAT